MKHKKLLGVILMTGILYAASLTVSAQTDVARNEQFTTFAQMQEKLQSKDRYAFSTLYLTEIESYYWNFSHTGEQEKRELSMNMVQNAYQNAEMFLDNGYLLDYQVLVDYCQEYKERGREDAYYFILMDCLNNPYLRNKPEAVVTATTYNGRDYAPVFDAKYYYDHNSDLQKAIGWNPPELLRHFVEYGINEGRHGNGSFVIEDYVATVDAQVYAQMAASPMAAMNGSKADYLGKYSYSLANYYGRYLNHYDYSQLLAGDEYAY